MHAFQMLLLKRGIAMSGGSQQVESCAEIRAFTGVVAELLPVFFLPVCANFAASCTLRSTTISQCPLAESRSEGQTDGRAMPSPHYRTAPAGHLPSMHWSFSLSWDNCSTPALKCITTVSNFRGAAHGHTTEHCCSSQGCNQWKKWKAVH